MEVSMDLTANSRKAAERAIKEIGVRRRGLGYSLIGIAIMIIAVVLNVRQIEGKL